jgi:hypothetical protein
LEKYPDGQLAGGLLYRLLRSEGGTRSCPRGRPVPTLPHPVGGLPLDASGLQPIIGTASENFTASTVRNSTF